MAGRQMKQRKEKKETIQEKKRKEKLRNIFFKNQIFSLKTKNPKPKQINEKEEVKTKTKQTKKKKGMQEGDVWREVVCGESEFFF